MNLYDRWASTYDFSRRPFAWLARRVHRSLDRVLVEFGAGRILDLGTGTGFVVNRLVALAASPELYVGIDASVRMLRRAARSSNLMGGGVVRLLNENVEDGLARLEGEGQSFDLVVSSLLLAHLPSPESTVRRSVRLLRPGGTACFIFFARDGALLLRPVLRLFLACLEARPVDVCSVAAALDGGAGEGVVGGAIEERRSLGGCLVLLSRRLDG